MILYILLSISVLLNVVQTVLLVASINELVELEDDYRMKIRD